MMNEAIAEMGWAAQERMLTSDLTRGKPSEVSIAQNPGTFMEKYTGLFPCTYPNLEAVFLSGSEENREGGNTDRR